MHTNKKTNFITLSKEQQIISRRLRKEYEQKALTLRTKVLDLNSTLSFFSKFENENPKKESQLYDELNKLKDALLSLHNNHRDRLRNILTENQKTIFDAQPIVIEKE